MKRIVLIRLDKIGDLISTLPSDQVPFLKSYDISWVISEGLSFIPKQAEPVRKFIELDKNQAKKSFKDLVAYLKKEKPDIAVSFQAPWWVSLALLWARVPLRVGVRSQWHSVLFLNKTLRQKRSEARQHEADYNSDLLAFACDFTKGVSDLSPYLTLKPQPSADILKKWNLQNKKFIVVHPGMAGSALNWPVQKYIDLISFLVKENTVVLTGTASDDPWLKPIKKEYAQNAKVLCLQGQLSSEDLLSLLSAAQVVVAPSTGVAHLSAAVSTPVITLFSPIQVQHPKRWAPRGENVKTLLPAVKCPAIFECLGPGCGYYFCMDRISVDQVLQEIKTVQKVGAL